MYILYDINSNMLYIWYTFNMKVILCLFCVYSQGCGKALDDFQIRRADQVRAAAQVGNLGLNPQTCGFSMWLPWVSHLNNQ